MRGWRSRARARSATPDRRVASTVVLALVLGGVVTAGLLHDGVATADVDLNDGGVWVTHPQESQVARLNHPVQMLDAGLTAASTDFDVLQEGQDVFVVDEAAGVLHRVDPATVSLTGAMTLPAERQTGLGGDVLAVLDTASGILRSAPVDAYGTLADEDAEPQAELGRDAHLAVGRDGTVHGLATGTATLVSVPREGEAQEADLGVDPAVLDDARTTVTAVGDRPAVVTLTGDGRLLVLRPGREPLDLGDAAPGATDVAAQHPATDGRDLVVATDTALVRVPLAGGAPTTEPAPTTAPPARPVVVDGCLHAAWGGSSPAYLHQCGADGTATTSPVSATTARPELVFRTNRDKVVLNDLVAGTVWLPEEQMEVVENWEDVTPPDDPSQDEEESSQELREQLPLDREQENRPPDATPDRVGVRSGGTTVLEVLANDSDPDGDLLTVADHDQPGFGEIRPVLGDRALQVQVPADATGATTVGYRASDGRGGDSEATVTVEVVPEEVNRPPEQLRDITLVLTAGASGQVNLLQDVRDPDGDEVMVTDAVTSADDEVRVTPDGVLTYVHSGSETGRREVTVTVSDGRDTGEVTVAVDVRPDAPMPPVPVFDHHRAAVGEEAVIEPLANDTDPNGEPLRLANVEEVPDATVVPDLDAGRFRFTADSPGTHYLTYIVVDDSGQSATGLVRVDVVAPEEAGPVAVQDTALLPAGGSVLVDVLANDTDPTGQLLAVQQVDAPAGTVVSVLDHRVLRISAQGTLPSTTRVGYTVSNGVGSAQGEVLVLPVAGDGAPQPPVAERDTANVRAGDYLTIPVLQNDSHPDGVDFSLTGLAEEPPPEQGRFFVSGDTVRFRAPDRPQTVQAVYRVTDTNGNEASARITVHVQADDGETNSAPRPEPLEARAFGGERVRVQVPMFGIDPDGDSVQLLGAEEGPELGRVVGVGPGYLDYEAYAHAVGTDEFRYAVRDRMGLVATAPVRVGVVPPPQTNAPPQAVDDVVDVRPGRALEVDVLANDTDPDGDPLYLAQDDAVDAVAGLEITARDTMLELRTPEEETEVSTGYRVTDQRGGQDTGVLTLRVSHDAPLQAPVARDDLVPDADIVGHDAVTVPVVDNDDDPDGTREDLTVAVVDAPDGVTVRGQDVRAELRPERQVVLYSVTDPDGNVAHAFLDIPGTEDTGPVLRPDADPVTVRTGETVRIALADHVVAPSGNPVRLTSEDSVSATSSDGSSPVVDATTLRFTSAPGYVGPAALTFEVTDDPEDGRTSVLTLPITVESDAGNTPPTFEGGTLQVAPGEPAVSLNLRNLTDDPDPGDFNRLRFEVVEAPQGFEAALDGPFLTAAVPPETPRGSVGEIRVAVTDGVNDPVVGTVEATVVPSTRRLPAVPDADLGTVDQGATAATDLLAGAYNPFPGEPLRITGTAVETGTAAVEVDGGRVAVTPGTDYVGRVVVVAEVEDVTGDPERRVTARVTMDVIGRPAAPPAPRVQDVGDEHVVLAWSAPASNGAPITGYTVSSAGRTWACPTTTCTVDGLTNDVEYTFTVRATNAVGDSEASGPSAAARPDVRPEAPGAPTLEFGDRQLEVTWPAADTSGSPVESYDLQLSPAVGSGQVSVTGTGYTWTGLENGVEYRVRARARNQAPRPSEWSAWSAGEVPAGPPAQPAAPTVQRVDSAVAEQITAAWQAPAANGDAISSYTVTVHRDGARFARFTVPAGTTRVTRDAPAGADYTVTVAATNKAGVGATSDPSRPVRSFTRPDAVGAVTAEATGKDGQVQLSFAEPASNGDPIQRYQVSISGGAWQALPGSRLVTGLNDGVPVSFRVRACNTYCGDPSAASGTAVPYGPLGTGTLTAQRTADRQVTFRWDAPAGNGRDIETRQVRYQDGGSGWTGWQNVGDSGSTTRGGDWSTTYRAEIRVVRADGQRWTSTASARTADQPPAPPSITVRKGDRVDRPDCTSASCRYVEFAYENLPAGTYDVYAYDYEGGQRTPIGTGTHTGTPHLSGDGTWQTPKYFGYPRRVEVEIVKTDGSLRLTDHLDW